MMKFYNKPEIEALALENVDVIETSGLAKAKEDLVKEKGIAADDVVEIKEQIAEMGTTWQW